MKKREKNLFSWTVIIFFILVIIFTSPTISGDYIIRNSTGGGEFNYSLGSVELYNFSVNNTFSDASSNITQVSIDFPSYLIFKGVNGSSAGSFSFSNGSGTLNWTAPEGEALVMNNSKEYFWFEANSSSTGGSFSGVHITNSTGTSTAGHLDFNIYSTDSGGSLDINIISPSDGEYLDTMDVWINATANDTVDTWIVNINGTNYTGINRTFDISEGDHDVVVYAKSSSGEIFQESVSFSVDATAPQVVINSPSETVYSKNEIWFNFSANEDIDEWIINYNETSGENNSYTGSGDSFSQKLEVPKGAWSLFVYAKDFAGNIGINDPYHYFSVDSSLSDDTEDSDNDTDSNDTGFWTKTYSETDVDLSKKDSIIEDCGTGERIEFNVRGDIFYAGVVELTESEAVINISDNQDNVLIQNTQGIADRMEYDLNDDNKKDILLVVNGIADNKATITVKASYSLESLFDDNQSSEEGENQTSENQTIDVDSDENSKTATVFLIIVGGIFVIALIGIIYYVQKHQEEEAEKRFEEKTTIYEDPDDLVGPG